MGLLLFTLSFVLSTSLPVHSHRGDAVARAILGELPDLDPKFVLWYFNESGADPLNKTFRDIGTTSAWLHALPVGNGRLAAMVYGNVNTTEQLQVRAANAHRPPTLSFVFV
jgi:hypothetical protein